MAVEDSGLHLMACVAHRRAMGLYAAKCMTDQVDELGPGGAFDLFAHATEFFGHKVRPPPGPSSVYVLRMAKVLIF